VDGWAASAVGVAGAVAGGLVVYAILRGPTLRRIEKEIHDSPIRWDDALLRRRVPARLALLIPALVAYLLAAVAPDDEPAIVDGARRILLAVIVLIVVFVISAILNSADEIYESHYDAHHTRPIKGYLQIVNIVVFLFGAVLIIAIAADRSPLVLLGGLGAMTAILLLVFQDTISGLVASVQLQSYDTIRQGDWIEAPQYSAEGEVVDVTLHTVKILNADSTMVTIPTAKLKDGGFSNWRPIHEGGRRRIRRALRIDLSTVRFLTEAEVTRFSCWELLADYITDRKSRIAEETDTPLPPGIIRNRRGITNVDAYRAYAQAYIRQHPRIHGDTEGLLCIVRLKEAEPDGLPVEVYAFSRDTGLEAFEEVRGEIFVHLIAMAPEFGLRVFQNPTGADMGRLVTR
jgi:miniconductance mechanosensitive channel